MDTAIAKFPHSSDQWDVMAWEATSLDLLQTAGIKVPQRRLTRVGERHVLILDRFDRAGHGRRVGYISALTALAASDGEHHDYADIAGVIRDFCLSPKNDHYELFDRVVASVALGNTDDHLRNHGFHADRGFWTLSPALDVNPTPDLWRVRSTSIMGAEAMPDESEALLALASECNLSLMQARDRIARIAGVFAGWQKAARRNRIREQEITMMAESIGPRLEALDSLARG